MIPYAFPLYVMMISLSANVEAFMTKKIPFILAYFLLILLPSLHPLFGQGLQYENQMISKMEIFRPYKFGNYFRYQCQPDPLAHPGRKDIFTGRF